MGGTGKGKIYKRRGKPTTNRKKTKVKKNGCRGVTFTSRRSSESSRRGAKIAATGRGMQGDMEKLLGLGGGGGVGGRGGGGGGGGRGGGGGGGGVGGLDVA